MKYNLENLYKQKLENVNIEPPDNAWKNINKKLTLKTLVKSLIFSAIIMTSVFIGFSVSNNNKTDKLELPSNTNIDVTNSKVYTNTEITEIVEENNTTVNNTSILQNSKTNVIYITSDDSNYSFSKVTDTNCQVAIVDTPKTYKGFYLSATSGCSPLTIILENKEKSNNLTWNVDNKKYSDTGIIALTLSSPDKYTISLSRNDNGVINYYSQEVTVYEQPKADFAFNSKINAESIITFNNLSENADSYSWYINNKIFSTSKDAVYNFPKKGKYKVTLIALNNDGCSDTISQDVTVEEKIQYVVFPNAIVPNQYGPNGGYYKVNSKDNDVFYPTVFEKEIKDYSLRIYNRKGVLLFESNDYKIGWDGYYNNTLVPIGVYVYISTGSFTDGGTFENHGSITILYNK